MNKNNQIIKIVFFLMVILSINLIISQSDWNNFGNIPSKTNAQLPTYYSLFNSTYNITTQTFNLNFYPTGDSRYKPLFSNLGNPNKEYMILFNDTSIYAYDNNFNVVTKLNIGYDFLSQATITDFNGDGIKNEVVGFWKVNSTRISFRSYHFDYLSETFSLADHTEYDLSSGFSDIKSSGIGCNDKSPSKCYNIISVYDSIWHNVFSVNSQTFSSLEDVGMIDTSNPFLESPSVKDVNNDGIDEALFSEDISGYGGSNGYVIQGNGSILLHFAYPNDATFFKSPNGYKIVSFYDLPCLSVLKCSGIQTLNLDGSNYWSVQLVQSSSSSDTTNMIGLAVADYNNDGYDDIWTGFTTGEPNYNARLVILNSSNGNHIFSSSIIYSPYLAHSGTYNIYNFKKRSITLGKMNSDNVYDFLVGGRISGFVYDTVSDNVIFSDTTIDATSCISVDWNKQGTLGIFCTGNNEVKYFSIENTNHNAYIDTVFFSPSTSINANQTLSVVFNGSDSDGDFPLNYKIKCGDSFLFSNDSNTGSFSCNYNNAGTYNLTIAVRDNFHYDYNMFSQSIIVSSSGGNNNVIGGQGGTMPIPTELVSTTNTNQGLLPEIYFGILGFLSYTLQPMIILIFVIFFALIIIALGVIIKKIAGKVSNM